MGNTVIFSDSLLKNLNINNVNVISKSGATFEGLNKISETSLPPPNTNIIICGGINDVGKGLTAHTILKHARKLKESLLKVPNCRVSFCTVPYCPKYCSLQLNKNSADLNKHSEEWIPSRVIFSRSAISYKRPPVGLS